jgi:hypothetical protein
VGGTCRKRGGQREREVRNLFIFIRKPEVKERALEIYLLTAA